MTVYPTSSSSSTTAAIQDYPFSEHSPLDHLIPHNFDPAHIERTHPTYKGPLGAILNEQSTTFIVWAPTAKAVRLRLYKSDAQTESYAHYDLLPRVRGSWKITVSNAPQGTYYDYALNHVDQAGKIHTITTADPWATACGANGERSMVIDLSTTNPDGWERDEHPNLDLPKTIVWETHIRDFSNNPASGIPQKHQGKYLAFTDQPNSDHSRGLDYLVSLGVSHVQLMPFYDYGSVDETNDLAYNWGYDPTFYNIPEGSYATDPHQGSVRIKECKTMIQAIHSKGLGVVMDVVFNHMYTPDNAFERMAPGYFCRRNPDGTLSNGSGCGNDMASERPMFSRFIVESLVFWAKEYHIDGFRFDLMGLIDVDTLNLACKRLHSLPQGDSILMYGEPWSAGITTMNPAKALANKPGLRALDKRIGWFFDLTRDAIKGDVFIDKVPGFINGNPQLATTVERGQNGLKGTTDTPKSARQLIQYVSSHDDLTLWDKLCITMRKAPSHTDYQGENGEDMLEANALAAGLIATSAGIPFILSGEEWARTKFGCNNSFNKSAKLNELDWKLKDRYESTLVAWYRTLFNIRASYPELFDEERVLLPCDEQIIAWKTHSLIVGANPTKTAATITIPEASTPSLLADSRNFISHRHGDDSQHFSDLTTPPLAPRTIPVDHNSRSSQQAKNLTISTSHAETDAAANNNMNALTATLTLAPRSFCIWKL